MPGLLWGQDVTPPAAPERLFATAGNGTVTLNWDSNSEADFGKYNIYGGISSAPTTVVASILTIGETTITISGLDNDITYYYRLSALDITGNVSAFSNEASATPFSPPVASDIRDGSSTDTDVDWWNDRSTFTFNWDPFEDNGTVTYKYAIGTSLGNLNSIVDWTANGIETSVTLTNPIFFEGFTYYMSVKGTDNTSKSDIATSDGVKMDYTAPISGVVYDGSTEEGIDLEFGNSPNELSANWSGFVDPPVNGAGSGIASYSYAIETEAKKADIVPWTEISLNESVSHEGLTIEDGVSYYFSVIAIDGAGNSSRAISSNGLTVDLSPPTGGQVFDLASTDVHIFEYLQTITFFLIGDPTDRDWITTSDRLIAYWRGFTDNISGVNNYKIALLDPDDTIIFDWTSTMTDSITLISGLSMEQDQKYTVALRCYDVAGNFSTVYSNGIYVDLTPPFVTEYTSDRLLLDDISNVKLIFSEPIASMNVSAESERTEPVDEEQALSQLTLDSGSMDVSGLIGSSKVIYNWSNSFMFLKDADGNTVTANEAIDDSETTINISSASNVTVFDIIKINTEQMRVTAISSNTLTVERGFAGTTAAAHGSGSVVEIKENALFISIYPPMVSMDYLTFSLTEVTDTRDLKTDEIIVGFNTRLLGDYDDNLKIDITDITQFIAEWPNDDGAPYTDIAPVTGEPPYFYSTPDKVTDLRDAMAFARLWRWSNEQMDTPYMATLQIGKPLDTKISSTGFSVILPNNTRSGEIEVQSQSTIRLTNGETSEDGLFLSKINANGKHQIINFGLFKEPAERDHSELNFSVDDPTEKVDFSYRFFGSSGNLISSGSVSLFDSPLPSQFALHQNSPNPFNPVTTIAFDIPEPTYVEIAIYDLLGGKVRTLVSKEMSPGFHSAVWNGKDDEGRLVASGMFIVRMSSSLFMDVKKMLMLK